MFLLDRINIFYFLISLCFGLFLCYISSPTPDIIIRYPTPENSDKQIYLDNVNNCFRFKSYNVPCPTDKKNIMEIPVENKIIKENFKLSKRKINEEKNLKI